MLTRSDIIIRPAKIEEILDLRGAILRAGLPRESAGFEGDDENTTHHFAAFQDKLVIACATLMQRPFAAQAAWQLRGMAVHSDFQRTGVGRQLLEFAQNFVFELSYSPLFWCNARITACKFYERQGWKIVSDQFDIPTAGPHVKMTQMIDSSLKFASARVR